MCHSVRVRVKVEERHLRAVDERVVVTWRFRMLIDDALVCEQRGVGGVLGKDLQSASEAIEEGLCLALALHVPCVIWMIRYRELWWRRDAECVVVGTIERVLGIANRWMWWLGWHTRWVQLLRTGCRAASASRGTRVGIGDEKGGCVRVKHVVGVRGEACRAWRGRCNDLLSVHDGTSQVFLMRAQNVDCVWACAWV